MVTTTEISSSDARLLVGDGSPAYLRLLEWYSYPASVLIRFLLSRALPRLRQSLLFHDCMLCIRVFDLSEILRLSTIRSRLTQFLKSHLHNQSIAIMWQMEDNYFHFRFDRQTGFYRFIVNVPFINNYDRYVDLYGDDSDEDGYFHAVVDYAPTQNFWSPVSLDFYKFQDSFLHRDLLNQIRTYARPKLVSQCHFRDNFPEIFSEASTYFSEDVFMDDAIEEWDIATLHSPDLTHLYDTPSTMEWEYYGYTWEQYVLFSLFPERICLMQEIVSFRFPILVAQTGELSALGVGYFMLEQQLREISLKLPVVLQLLALFVSLRETSSWKGAAAAVSQFVLSLFGGDMMCDLAQIVFEEMTNFQFMVVEQSAGFVETVGMVWDMLHDDAFRTTPLYNSFWGVFSALSVGIPLTMIGVCPDMQTWRRYADIIQPMLTVSTNEFGLRVVALIQATSNSLYGFIRTRDPALLLGGANHTGWLQHANAVVMNTIGSSEGSKPIIFTAEERIEIIKHCIGTGDKLVKRMEHFKVSPSSIVSVQVQLASLRSVLVSAESHLQNNQARVPPFMVMLVGEPGIGKTEFIKVLHATLMRAIDFPTSPNTMYALRAGNKYYDGYSDMHTGILFDDPDKNTAKSTADCMLHAGLVIEICNGAPLVAKMAAVELKGKVFLKPLTCYYSTNLETCNLFGLITDAAPFWRRVTYRFRMKLKKEYMVNPGVNNTLDSFKAKGAVNLWDFEVQTFRSLEDSKTFAVAHLGTDFVTDNTSELLQFVKNRFLSHTLRENERLAADAVTTFCETCGMVMKYHGPVCPNESFMRLKAQGVVRDVATRVTIVARRSGSPYVFFSLPIFSFLIVAIANGFLWLPCFLGAAFGGYRMSQIPNHVLEFYLCYFRFVWVHPRAALRMGVCMMQSLFSEVNFEAMALEEAYNNAQNSLRQQSAAFVALGSGCLVLVGMIVMLGKRKLDHAKDEVVKANMRAGKWESVVTGQAPVGATPETLIMGDTKPELMNLGVKSIWTQPQPGKFARHPLPSGREMPTVAGATVSLGQLCDQVARNIAIVNIGNMEFRAVRFMDNFFIFPGHSLRGDSAEVTYIMSEKVLMPGDLAKKVRAGTAGKQIVRAGTEFLRIPGKDLAVVWLSSAHPSGASIVKHVVDTSQFGLQHQFDDAVMLVRSENGELGIHPLHVGVTQVGGSTANGFAVPHRRLWKYPVSDVVTQDGWCGSPIVVRRGNSAWVAGIHVSAFIGIEGHSDELCAVEILSVVEALKNASPMAVSFAPIDLSQGTKLKAQMGPLHAKSMLNGITTLNCEILGSLEVLGERKVFRAHEKSHVRATSFAMAFDDLRSDLLGEEKFVAPRSNGIEVDGVFKHPILNAIVQLETARNSNPDELEWALRDYLAGVEDLPGIDTFRVLTLEETIFGVKGGSIGPFDLTTSMGYPFFKKKSAFVHKHLLPLGDNTYMDDIVWEQLRWAEETLCSGHAVIPVVSWTLKDEAIKESKNALRGQRVFNSLPFYFNILLKQYFGPVMAFMGLHKEFFECYAGMNLASSDATHFRNTMTFFGEERCIDGDMKWCDKGIDNVMMCVVGRALVEIAHVLGYTPEQKKICALLFAGLMQMCVFVKGDVMLLTHSNPSGSMLTVVINSIYLSCYYRVAFHRGMIHYGMQYELPFRVYIHLATLGDDNIANVSKEVDWFTFVWLAGVFSDNGKYLVPADKTDGLYAVKSFVRCSFLKRRFGWSNDLKNYAAVLEQVSLVKMLTTRGFSSVSSKDQEAGILASACLEYFLKGRDAYEKFSERVLAVCAEHDISTHWWHGYDYHLENFAADHFQTWIC